MKKKYFTILNSLYMQNSINALATRFDFFQLSNLKSLATDGFFCISFVQELTVQNWKKMWHVNRKSLSRRHFLDGFLKQGLRRRQLEIQKDKTMTAFYQIVRKWDLFQAQFPQFRRKNPAENERFRIILYMTESLVIRLMHFSDIAKVTFYLYSSEINSTIMLTNVTLSLL